jgi:hypothetical protein
MPYDYDKIRDVYDKARKRSQAERYSYERSWFQNCLFYLGIQWIIYDQTRRKWRPRKLAGKWVPRPVTNKFAAIANTQIQVLSSKRPDVSARPGSDSPEDIAAAAVADRNFHVILQEIDDKRVRDQMAAWMVLCGNVILHSCYDKDIKHGSTFLRHMKCQVCGKTFAPDKAGFPQADTLTPPAMSASVEPGSDFPIGARPMSLPGQPETMGSVCPKCGSTEISDSDTGEELPTGRMKVEVFSPFEFFVDLECRCMDDAQEILIRRRYNIDLMRERYSKPNLEPDNSSGGSLGLNLLRAIAYASGNSAYGTGVSSGKGIGDDQSITVDMLWKRPCKEFPKGLVAIFANETLLNDGNGTDEDVKDGIPYRDRDDKPIWPWHLVKFDEVPGRFFGRTPMDDIAPKQEQRNRLESLIQLIITRCANPVWLVPKNLGVTEITGEPGQILEGNWAMDPRLKPERIPGDNVPTSIIAWLEKIDNDMDVLGGTLDVMRGSAPPGVTAGTALRMLLERAVTRFTPPLQHIENEWQGTCQDCLTIFQQFGTEERINKIQGPGNTWEVERFSKATINGAVDIIVEAGSAIPKSTVGDQALVQDLAAMGVINPQMGETQYKILEKFGSTGLLGDVDLNVRYAQRENWKFENEGVTPQMDPILDQHQVHLIVHKGYALKSDFEKLEEIQKQSFMNHILQHTIAMAPPPVIGSQPNSSQVGTAGAGGGGNGSGPEVPRGARGSPSPVTKQDAQQPPVFPG